MTRPVIPIATVLFAALLTIPALHGADTALMDELVSRQHEFGKFNGVVLVAANGEVIFKKGYGLANREWDIPNETDTRFRIGSITKQFTAALILKLVEDGKIRLEGSLADYVPEYPEDVAKRVTVHQLMTHTSGIKSYTGMQTFREVSRDPYSPDDFISFFAGEPLDFEPGDRFRYNNSGYFLLGVIIEKVTGQPYEEVLEERILKPLGMNATGFDRHDILMPKRAAGYAYGLDGYKNAPYLDMSLPYAAGSLYSTVEDLYIWDRAWAAGKVLSPAMSEKMFTPHVKAGGRAGDRHYGYGWVIESATHPAYSADKLQVIGHGGGINGFNTLIHRIPEDDHLIVLFNNTPAANLNGMAIGIRALLYDRKPKLPPEPLSRELFSSYREGGIERLLARYKEIKKSENGNYQMGLQELFRLARYFEEKKLAEEEIAILELATNEHPKRAPAFLRLGEALKRVGRTDEATKAYAQALQLDPKSADQIADRLKELNSESP